jgi:uncharacterized protein RhaS with RHS repeats
MQLGVRFYDAEVGRFTQVDPAGDGLNWYTYAADRPVVSVDPDGRRSIQVCGNGGHLWLCLDGNKGCWGFHPVKKSDKVVDGVVKNDDEYMKDDGGGSSSSGSSSGGKRNKKRCKTVTVDDCQLKKLVEVLQNEWRSPPQYFINPQFPDDEPYNCVTWIDHVMRKAGIDYHSSGRLPWPHN